ncbi:hypothetical protein KFE94_02165 [bacterium SCSIO 12643]|nr:hypothetical protein KFE94_02165 [bacterium SCSIO 12643]
MDKLFKLFFWLRIFISPTLIGVILGLITLAYLNDPYGLVIGILLSITGIILGIVFAEKMRKKHGTARFISKVDSSIPVKTEKRKPQIPHK